MITRKHFHFSTIIIFTSLATNTSFASGFRIPEVTVAGTATSNALVANTSEVGAAAYNPASISFQEKAVFQAGLNNISYEAAVTTAAPNTVKTTESQGESNFLVPNFNLIIPGNSDIAFGLLINSPFGLETKWPDETFDIAFSGAADVLEPETSRIKMLNINPNISFRLDPSSSIAVGLDVYDLQELVFNSQAIRIKGDGTGLGWNIAYLKKLGKFNIGVSYRSAVEVDINGTQDARAVNPNAYTSAKASLEFPDIFQAGIYYQASDNFAVEFDIDRTGWSSFDTINITSGLPGLSSTSTNKWEDSWAYRLGFTYKLSGATKLMFGYSMDESPQPDANFSARVPDADRQLFSVGVSHMLANNWLLEAAYMYVDVDSRTIASATAFAGGDANGTNAYNGTYETDVSLIGVSLTIPL